MRKTAAKLLAIAAIATSVATVAAGTAVADPASLPAAQDIVGVGSDTTQAVLNQFSTDYNAFLGASSTLPRLYSWDATGTSPITTKSGATSIARPNGSGAGVKALENNTNATVSFARSSRGPATGDQVTDLFVAYAKDAVSWAAKSGGHAPANLSTAQLKGIYECTITNWQTIDPTLANATIKPFLPQADSGTRSFFLKTIGGGTTSVVPGACVTQGTQENQGTDAVLNDADAVVPYSVAHYIGQVYFGHAVGSDAQGPLTVRNVDGVTAINTTAKTIDSTFAGTSYARVVYNVVRKADWTNTGTLGTALRGIFGTTGWVCTNATAQADIVSYGFLPVGSCGTTTHI
ncbi:PstS family phosphate ABC transporter substrate-binding protein [Kitasatospora purpeofusca]|uniref:PstS family phosphate ABC transporter substrate-binding protein n=1 Tax=Kitasatospora purpeofusca TaxID=67352 RepID=UPI00386CC14E|nr:substrate-binding domain-containing protein [Kitasatospora purpeofusca]